jgi:hypothetical protein
MSSKASKQRPTTTFNQAPASSLWSAVV